ncbi:auxin-responsive protein IAA12-like [Aristolochia californica]|uniref:auxin-responsive protein IAA12-like n=1 Tax=Aristolochia californica TaxID=171875 RepID=UPI0035DCFF64
MHGGGGGGGDSSGSSNNGSMSTVSKAEVIEQDYVGLSEVSSYSKPSRMEGEELELGLGLGLGPKAKPSVWGEYCRILTAKDFPSIISPAASPSPAARPGVAGTKRAADSVPQEVASNSPSPVVGWPPIRAYRMNSLVNQAKALSEDTAAGNDDNSKKNAINSNNKINNNTSNIREKGLGKSLFVKVNMDGIPIGRKVDLSAHASYQSLAQTLENMFYKPTTKSQSRASDHEVKAETPKISKLLDESSEFVLTYEDREGDWMLVGDVPWGMFLSTVKRLRIMRTSEANGLAPRIQYKADRQRSKLV